jgi:TfoX/Sxy family transcriptional regulator of competence genes
MEKGTFGKPTDEDKAWFAGLVPDHPDVTSRPMFGNVGGFVNGNMFLCLFGQVAAVRLDEQGRAELLAEDGAEIFEPMAGRRR